MSATPGAIGAFKAKPAPAVGIKPQQIGGVKFPGKIDPSKIGFKIAAPTLPTSALSNPALGAMFGLLFGRVASMTPGLKDMLSNPALRDAALGASVATVVAHILGGGSEPAPQVGEATHDPYNPRPAPMTNGWNLQ